jgi:hypothetical protein
MRAVSEFAQFVVTLAALICVVPAVGAIRLVWVRTAGRATGANMLDVPIESRPAPDPTLTASLATAATMILRHYEDPRDSRTRVC